MAKEYSAVRVQWLQVSLLALALLLGIPDLARAGEQDSDPFRAHMQRMLTTDDEWRTANPDYVPGKRQPREFALQLQMQPDGVHALGELMGIYDDDSRVTYWSLIAMFNPVTQKIVTQQIGWDGTLVYGENDVQRGNRETMDAVEYNANGTMKIVRHISRFVGKSTHESDVFERDALGHWSLQSQWVWHRVPGADAGGASGEYAPGAVDEFANYLVSGSGQWRAPNPDHVQGSGNESAYGMNFYWGLRKQFVTGEIVSVAEDGALTKDWSMYVVHNPVTGKANLYQTGSSGVFFQGELRSSAAGRHTQTGLIYLPNGTAKSVRDEVRVVDEDIHVSEVFERDAEGGWIKVREWEWTQVPER